MCLLRILTGLTVALAAAIAWTQEPDARVTFRDVTAAAGIDFVHTNGRAGELFVIEVKGSGAGFIDYDNDGDLDIYAVNGNNLPGARTDTAPINHLYRNNGDGSFTDVTAEAGVGESGYGHGVAIADYDNDGDQDMFIANYGANVLYRNDGDGSFTDVTEKSGISGEVWSVSAAFCDVDNDGFLDLYVANYLVFDIARDVKLPTGPGFYEGELDNLYRNNGDGTFSDVTKEAIGEPNGKGLGVVCFDYDDDGDMEIYVANDGVANLMYENNGDGTFEDVTLFSGTGVNGAGETEAGMGVDAGDYDNDGDMDLFVTNYKGESNTLMRNDGGGIFTDVTARTNLVAPSLPYVTFGTAFFDPDNDGDLDIFVANGHTEEELSDHEQPDQLFENQGDGRFEDVSALSGAPFLTKRVGRGAAFGDFDNDGDVDLLVSNKNAPLMLLQNQGGNRRNWLAVKLRGSSSNRDGIGARITVSAPGFVRSKDVKSGYSMFSSNDLRAYFGLDRLERVDLRIRWPSGAVDHIADVPANRLITVEEGTGSGEIVALQPIRTEYAQDAPAAQVESGESPEQIEAQVEALKGLLDTDTDDVSAYLDAARALPAWIYGRTKAQFERLLAADPQRADYFFEYAQFLLANLHFEQAIDSLQRAVALGADSAEIHAYLALAALRIGKYDISVEHGRRSIELGDERQSAYLTLAQALVGLQRLDEAEATLNELLERYPRFVAGYLELGRVHAEGGRLEHAASAYGKAVAIEPGAGEARYQLAEVYRRLGDARRYDEQIRLVRLLETESSVFKGGMSREHEIRLLQREIRMNPMFGQTRANRQIALRYGEIGDLSNGELYSFRARSAELLDDVEEAIDHTRRLVELDPSPATRREFAAINTLRERLAVALHRANGYDAAASAGLEADGRDRLQGGDYAAALSLFRASLTTYPYNVAAYRGLVSTYMRGGLGMNYARALARKAVMMDQSAESYRLLAEVLRTMGDESAAQRALLMVASD